MQEDPLPRYEVEFVKIIRLFSWQHGRYDTDIFLNSVFCMVELWYIYKSNVLHLMIVQFWPVFGWINHQYVPLHLRVIFQSMVAFCW